MSGTCLMLCIVAQRKNSKSNLNHPLKWWRLMIDGRGSDSHKPRLPLFPLALSTSVGNYVSTIPLWARSCWAVRVWLGSFHSLAVNLQAKQCCCQDTALEQSCKFLSTPGSVASASRESRHAVCPTAGIRIEQLEVESGIIDSESTRQISNLHHQFVSIIVCQ